MDGCCSVSGLFWCGLPEMLFVEVATVFFLAFSCDLPLQIANREWLLKNLVLYFFFFWEF